MNTNQYKIKDKKIQFYLPVKKQGKWYKNFPYPEEVYNEGGLWAYARDKSQIEKYQTNMSLETEIIECRINYNPIINSGFKAYYKHKIYDVGIPDNYEGYTEETKFILTTSVDNNQYEGNIYENKI